MAAFTLTELMIAVTLIVLLAIIAVPYFIHTRNASQVRACITNLRRLEDAKSQWAIETKQRDTAVPTNNDIAGYLGYNKMPVCPASGSYRVRRLTANPSCSKSAIGHTLGNLNMDDDPAFD